MNDELKEKLQSMRRDPKESPVLVNFENSSMQFVALSGELPIMTLSLKLKLSF